MNMTTTDGTPTKEIDFFPYLTEPQLKDLKRFWKRLDETIGPSSPKDQKTEPSTEPEEKNTKADDDQARDEAEELKRLLMADKTASEYWDELWHWIMMDDPDKMVLKFIRARKFKSTFESLKMLINALSFRIQRDLKNATLESQAILNVAKIGKAFIFGFDRSSSPIFRIVPSKHKTADQSPKDLEDFILYAMETLRLFIVPPAENVTLLMDQSGFGMSNMDWKCTTFMIPTLESYYPETLNLQIILNPPWIFQGLWKVISPMVDASVKSKITFTTKNEDLLKVIDKHSLFKSEGGESDFKWMIPANYPSSTIQTSTTTTTPTKNDKPTGSRQSDWSRHLPLTPEEEELKLKELKTRSKLAEHFTTLTRHWLALETSDPTRQSEHSQRLIQILKLRELLKLILRAQYLKLMVYIQPQTIYHYLGFLDRQEPGVIKLKKSYYGPQADEEAEDDNLIVFGRQFGRPALLKLIQEKLSALGSDFDLNVPSSSPEADPLLLIFKDISSSTFDF